MLCTRAAAMLHRNVLAFAVLSSVLIGTGCGSDSTTLTSSGIPSVQISPRPVSLAVGQTVTFSCSASTTSSPGCTWIVEQGGASDMGNPSGHDASNTFRYTAPATPPVYPVPGGIYEQGVVNLEAVYGFGYDSIPIAITAPTISVGILNPVSSVALGSTATFTGYAVGTLNTRISWQVDGVNGGSTVTGTIRTPYDLSVATYSAPATLPAGGNTVTLTAVSQADPTKTASVVVTLH